MTTSARSSGSRPASKSMPISIDQQEAVVKLERLLLAIEVHGPAAAYEPAHANTYAWLQRYWWHGYLQVKEAIREAKRRKYQPIQHESGCACWDCVAELYAWAARHRAKLQAAEDAPLALAKLAGAALSDVDRGDT